MTQEEKIQAASDHSKRFNPEYRLNATSDFLHGIAHAESTHSKDIGELVKALKQAHEIIHDCNVYQGANLVKGEIEKFNNDYSDLIQKHSSNT